MDISRNTLVTSLIFSLIASGCQSDSHSTTIVDYQRQSPPLIKKAPDSEVYVLWRWDRAAPVPGAQSPASPKSHQVEVSQVYADRGSFIGFRRVNGQLIALAGATTRPLDEANYTWKALPGSSAMAESHDRKTRDAFAIIGGVALAIVLFPVIIFLTSQSDANDDSVFDSDPSNPHNHSQATQHRVTANSMKNKRQPASQPARG